MPLSVHDLLVTAAVADTPELKLRDSEHHVYFCIHFKSLLQPLNYLVSENLSPGQV